MNIYIYIFCVSGVFAVLALTGFIFYRLYSYTHCPVFPQIMNACQCQVKIEDASILLVMGGGGDHESYHSREHELLRC